MRYQVDGIIHLAAESHVDRSIKDPFTFAQTNVMGTLALLQAAKLYWESLPEKYEGKRFIIFLPMKYMGHWNLTGLSSRRKPNISLIVRILQVRQVVITLFVLFMTHMVCLPL